MSTFELFCLVCRILQVALIVLFSFLVVPLFIQEMRLQVQLWAKDRYEERHGLNSTHYSDFYDKFQKIPRNGIVRHRS